MATMGPTHGPNWEPDPIDDGPGKDFFILLF